MNSKLKKIIPVFLALILCLGLFACQNNVGEQNEPVAEISFLDYDIIRPERCSGKLLDELALMYTSLKALSGANNEINDDFLMDGDEPDPNAKEILVGHTNRPESKQVMSQLGGNEWAVAVVGKKVVIVGMTESITPAAIQYFINTYLADGASGKLPGDLFYKEAVNTALIVDRGQPVYKLVRSDKADDGTLEMMNKVYDAVMDVTGVTLDVGTDRFDEGEGYSAEAYEIVFGDTAYPETQEVKATVDPNSYTIRFVGNKVVVFGWNIEALAVAADAFVDILTEACYTDSEGVSTISLAKDNITEAFDDESYYIDVPDKAGDRKYDKVYDCYDGAVMLYWENATQEMTNGYFADLEADGHTKYQSLDNTSISSATYVKNGAAVHVYFLKHPKTLRVITQDDAVLPMNGAAYEKKCEVAVTQLGLDYVSDPDVVSGMGYLIRLEDGTFAVVDGGNALANNAKNLYDLMVEQKPEGVEEIVIRAWIVTHGHSDHYGVYNLFAKSYKDKVTVETLVGNDPPEYIHEKCDTPGHKFVYAQKASAFSGCKYIKAHTGQQLFLPGFTVTILQTHEDIFPEGPLVKFNSNASMVLDGVVAADGTRIMWLADIEGEGATVLKEHYWADLKCDIMQVAHHGIKGGSPEVYEFCDPDIAFWPSNLEKYERDIDRYEQNKYLKKNADQIVVSGNGNYTVWLGAANVG